MAKEEAKKRDGRIPLHKQKKVGIEVEKGFVHRLVVDKGGNGSRLERFEKGGWERVPNKQPIDVGNGDRGYYMRIPKKYYDADQKEKQEKCNYVMEQIGHEQKGMLDSIPLNRRTGKVTIN